MCLPSQVTVFLLRQAGAIPGLSLRFVNFGLAHLETNRREYGAAPVQQQEKKKHTHSQTHGKQHTLTQKPQKTYRHMREVCYFSGDCVPEASGLLWEKIDRKDKKKISHVSDPRGENLR